MRKMPVRKKRRKRKFNKILIGVVAVASILGLGYLIYSFSRPPPQTFQYKAAIVDHLSFRPETTNQTFVQRATAILKAANFSVDYYEGEKVDVEFYRNLPTHGYGLIIFRVHSAAGEIGGEWSLALFTSENYTDKKYTLEQLDRCLVRVSFILGKGPFYFGISPKFVRSSMNGRFGNTIIIMMGCDGLTPLNNTRMADAFIEKGAKVYISWNGDVSTAHTDQATTLLLQHLTLENKTIKMAVEETRNEVGPDPTFKSELLYHPDEAGNLAIPNIAILTINVTKTVSRTNNRKSRWTSE